MAGDALRQTRIRRRRTTLPVIAGIVTAAIALSGQVGAGLGYGLLLVSVMLLGGAAAALALVLFTANGARGALPGAMRWLFLLGAWAYIYGVCVLSGYFAGEAIWGRVELKWMLFGPAALAAIAAFEYGLYRLIFKNNRPSWIRYGTVIRPDNIEPESMRRTFVSEIVLHASLFSVSGLRWLRHTLILWGFALMFVTEIVAVFVREGLPAFGFADVWEMQGHPLRSAFDFAFDFFGAMVLLGCLLAIVWRFVMRDGQERKYADTPSLAFLLFVVVSGFVLEAARILMQGFPVGSGYSFAGMAFTLLLPNNPSFLSAIHDPLWYAHVFGSLAFIAYIPVHRLVHSCATPIGRMMNSQTRMLAEKRLNSIKGLFRPGVN